MAATEAPERLSGYETDDEYLATRYTQGGRQVYTVDLSIPQLVSTLPRPDPELRLTGNRRINLPHARAFSTYILQRVDSVVPPLLLRCPEGVLGFERLRQIGRSEWGIVRVPRLARNDLKIVDGQHRVLGFHLAWETLTSDMSAARDRLGAARRTGDDDNIRHAQGRVRELEEKRRRLENERVSLLIVIVDDPDEYKQVFVDIADNAKGITRTTRALFDSQKIVHRCLDKVMEHPLLLNRVDLERDRVLGENPNIMGAKHIADVIRTLQVGIAGRISARLEDELKESELIKQTNTFFDVLVAAFPDLARVTDGSIAPSELRKRSLLGSVVMYRVFAGCYHELVREGTGSPPMNRLQVQRFFEKLVPFMTAPVPEDSPWVKWTDAFVPEVMGPHAAGVGTLRALTQTLVQWALKPPKWLEAGRTP